MKKLVYFLFPMLILALFIFFTSAKALEKNLEAPGGEAENIQFHVGSEATVMAIVENLHYYGFIKNKRAFLHALKYTQDTTPGGKLVIEVGEGTIELNADYKISQDMDAWQLSDVLLNKATPNDCTHGCPGMFYPQMLPGGELAPTLKEKYEWVKTYEDCVEARGQLSNDEAKCVSPDGREFEKDKEGSRPFVGG